MSFFTSCGHVCKISDTQTSYHKRVSLEKVTRKAFLLAVTPKKYMQTMGHVMLDPETMQHEFERKFEGERNYEYQGPKPALYPGRSQTVPSIDLGVCRLAYFRSFP